MKKKQRSSLNTKRADVRKRSGFNSVYIHYIVLCMYEKKDACGEWTVEVLRDNC